VELMGKPTATAVRLKLLLAKIRKLKMLTMESVEKFRKL
jgi:hypothetical protein